ncbi:MAG: glycoside hydrolase family 5 protein [Xanthomonadales bacterium]|jgi:endoglucanase|nr:glycoside hydrolase family 5 protein [Xanthomonadales bacterium]
MKPFTLYSAVILFFLGLSTPVLAADAAPDPIILGQGTNLAHWLSQTRLSGEKRRNFITEKDIAYIAELGFEHVRMPIDEMQMWDEQGRRDEDAFEILHNAIRWSLANDLKVVVDLHILRSHHFNAEDKPLWTDPAEQEQFIDLWRSLSEALNGYPTATVVYELMNEPVADDPEDWNRLVAKAFAAIRELEPERTVVIGSNRWQGAETFDELVVPDDRRIILSYHFYEPFIFTHYKTSWNFMKDYDGKVRYPGMSLSEEQFQALPDNLKQELERFAGKSFNKQALLELMEKPLRRAKELGLPLYCGEYGVFNAAPLEDELRWYRDVLEIFEENGVSHANWNYKSDQFGFVGLNGKPIEPIRDVLVGK